MSLEEKKQIIEVNKTFSLIDLNGSKKNFISEVFVKARKSVDRYVVSVCTQDELDEDKIKFYNCDENGEFHTKFSFKENRTLHHYLVIKKTKDDKSNEPIICNINVKLKEIEVSEVKLEDILPQPAPPVQTTEVQQNDQKMELYKKLIEEKENSGNINMYFIVSIISAILFIYLFLNKKTVQS